MVLDNIIRLCKEKHITIAELERRTEISNGTIRRWNESSPSLNNAKRVADFFGVTIDALMQ